MVVTGRGQVYTAGLQDHSVCSTSFTLEPKEGRGHKGYRYEGCTQYSIREPVRAGLGCALHDGNLNPEVRDEHGKWLGTNLGTGCLAQDDFIPRG